MSSLPLIDPRSKWALSFAEAAEVLSISESTLRRIRPELEAVGAVITIGRHPRITTQGLDRYVTHLEATAGRKVARANGSRTGVGSATASHLGIALS